MQRALPLFVLLPAVPLAAYAFDNKPNTPISL